MAFRRAEALYDFIPTASVELKIQKGDVVLVRRMSVGEGWWEGELNTNRGLFPSSYVKLLPPESPTYEQRSQHLDRPKTPLTPGGSKKVFMESMLAPQQDHQLYSKEKAAELFVRGHSDIGVTVGPSWDCKSPTYSITVQHQQADSRFSGLKRWSSYVVETAQLGCRVTRKFKHFLWLYDKLAELFPCISLPPLPVKQYSGPRDPDGVEARRRGLERFLARAASHPVIGSTKLFHTFLTAKDDKEWKIGRQNSNIKLPKSAKKLFGAPVYNVVKYPAYNVPLNQLASIDKFSKFSRLLEMNVHALETSYLHVSGTNTDMLNSLKLLSMDIQTFTKGQQPTSGAKRRKLMAPTNAPPGVLNGSGSQAGFHVSLSASQQHKLVDADGEESDEVEEEGGGGEWNWREDERFTKMARDLHDIAGSLRQVAQLGVEHQEALELRVLDVLREYSGIIHTLPVLVKLHEEAMELFNASKEKDSKKEAESIRKHCDSLNNILLSEFDHFSKNMVQDFEGMMEGFLLEQANFHRQLADQWDGLHERFRQRLSSRRQSTARARSSGANSAHSHHLGGGRSGSFTASFPSSGDSTPDMDFPDPVGEEPSRFDDYSGEEDSAADTTVVPSYISVERKVSDNHNRADELSESDIIDPEVFVSKKKKSLPEPPIKPAHLRGESTDSPPAATPAVSSAVHVPVVANTNEEHHYDNYKPRVLGSTPPDSESKAMDSIVFLPTSEYESCTPRNSSKVDETSPTKMSPTKASPNVNGRYENASSHLKSSSASEEVPSESSSHEYANLEFGKNNLPPAILSALSKGGAASKSSVSSSPSKKPMPIQRKRNQAEEKDPQVSKPSPQSKLNKKPLPPVKPSRLQGSSDVTSSRPVQSPEGAAIDNLREFGDGDIPIVGKMRPHSSSMTELTKPSEEPESELSFSLGATKPRSYTNVDLRPDLRPSLRPDLDKKEPLLSPAPPSSMVVIGQVRPSNEPIAAKPTDSRNTELRDSSQVISPPPSSHDPQPPQRSKLTKKPLPPSKAKLLASSALKSTSAQPTGTDSSNTPKSTGKSVQVSSSAKSKATPPPKPSRVGLTRAISGGGSDEDTSPMGRSELMRKLSQRRMRIEEQISGTNLVTSPTSDSSSNMLDSVSERNSSLSTSSSLSEVVVAYHSKKTDGSGEVGRNLSSVSPNGAPATQAIDRLEEVDESATLAQFGIIEDVSGGSYVI